MASFLYQKKTWLLVKPRQAQQQEQQDQQWSESGSEYDAEAAVPAEEPRIQGLLGNLTYSPRTEMRQHDPQLVDDPRTHNEHVTAPWDSVREIGSHPVEAQVTEFGNLARLEETEQETETDYGDQEEDEALPDLPEMPSPLPLVAADVISEDDRKAFAALPPPAAPDAPECPDLPEDFGTRSRRARQAKSGADSPPPYWL
jgi:hypothetical protein